MKQWKDCWDSLRLPLLVFVLGFVDIHRSLEVKP